MVNHFSFHMVGDIGLSQLVMTNLDFHHKKLLFFNNKSYYGKAKRLPVNPALYDGGRRFEFQKILEFSEFKTSSYH